MRADTAPTPASPTVTEAPPGSLFFWLADRAGCGYYRGIIPTWSLREHAGWVTEADTQLPLERLEQRDLAVLAAQRIVKPGPSETWQRITRGGLIPTVFDTDDALELISPSSATSWAYYHGVGSDGALERYGANLAVADVVTTSTAWLAQYVTDRHRPAGRVEVVPNTIAAEALDTPPAPELEHLVGRSTVGYAGSDTHYADVGQLRYALERVARHEPEVLLHLVGVDWCERFVRWSDPTWERGAYPLCDRPGPLRFPPARRVHTEWVPSIPDYYAVAATFSIGLAPLDRSPFNRAKSPLKLLEYAALGVPWIATDFGPYRAWYDEGEEVTGGPIGLLARTEVEWWQAIRLLLHEPAAGAELAARARRHAEGYTAQAWVARRAELYRGLT